MKKKLCPYILLSFCIVLLIGCTASTTVINKNCFDAKKAVLSSLKWNRYIALKDNLQFLVLTPDGSEKSDTYYLETIVECIPMSQECTLNMVHPTDNRVTFQKISFKEYNPKITWKVGSCTVESMLYPPVVIEDDLFHYLSTDLITGYDGDDCKKWIKNWVYIGGMDRKGYMERVH